MARHVSSRVFVGRGEELSQLAAARQHVRGGEARAVLIGGEAGVGKTRLVGEVIAEAQAAGEWVLTGNCAALSGASVPFLPMIEALGGLPDELVDQAPDELTGLLRRDVPTANRPPAAPARVFELLLALLRRATRTEPVVLAIEDVHWADRSTLDLLAFLIRNLRDEQLLLIATFREEDVDRHAEFRAWLAEAYGGGAERLVLTRLGRDEHAELLAGVLGAPAPPELSDDVFARSDGNPFFAEELLATTRGVVGSAIPESLRDTLRARLEQLKPAAQAIVRAAAASGRRVHHRLLTEVVELPEAQVTAALREALRHHILVTDGAGVAFRHPLLREVAYDDLLPGERETLHERYAGAVAREPALVGDGAGAAAEIAEHCWRGRDVEAALVAAVRAGVEAEAVHAPAESQLHFERALDLWDKVRDPDALVPLSRAEVLARAAAASELRGHPERATELIEDALALVDAEEEPVRAALLHERRGWYLDREGRSADSLAAYEQAVRLLPAEPSADRARVLALAGYEFLRADRWSEVRELCEAALASARDVGARLEEGLALVPLGHVLTSQGDGEAGIACLRHAREILCQLGRPAEAARTAINLSDVLEMAGRFEEAASVGLEGFTEARAAGLELTYGMFALSNATRALIRLGRWDETERLTAEALARPLTGLPAASVYTVRAELEVWRGHFAEAERHLTLARQAPVGELPIDWRYDADELDAELAIWQHRPDDALAAAGATTSLPGTDAALTHRLRLARVTIRALAARAELARVRGAAELRDESVTRAREVERDIRRRLDDAGDALSGPEEAATLALIVAERTRVEHTPDPPRWAAAVDALEAWGPPHRVAYGRWRWAEALLATGAPRADAAAILRPAHRTAEQLDAAPLNEEIQALARRARIDLAIEASPPTAALSLADELGLTRRELDVLEHLAAGATNRQIADTLFISIKTAGVHVSNILRKLDAKTRSEAAAVAHRSGLLEHPSTATANRPHEPAARI